MQKKKIIKDHSKNTKNKSVALIQTIIGPFWSFICDGCEFKDIRGEIEKYSKFEKLEIKEYIKLKGFLDSLLNPIFYGYGQK